MQFLKYTVDGSIWAFNEALVSNPLFEVVEADEPPHPEQFVAPEERKPAPAQEPAPAKPKKGGAQPSTETKEPGAKTGDVGSSEGA